MHIMDCDVRASVTHQFFLIKSQKYYMWGWQVRRVSAPRVDNKSIINAINIS